MTEKIEVFTQNSIRIGAGIGNVYIDPFQMKAEPKDADASFFWRIRMAGICQLSTADSIDRCGRTATGTDLNHFHSGNDFTLRSAIAYHLLSLHRVGAVFSVGVLCIFPLGIGSVAMQNDLAGDCFSLPFPCAFPCSDQICRRYGTASHECERKNKC